MAVSTGNKHFKRIMETNKCSQLMFDLYFYWQIKLNCKKVNFSPVTCRCVVDNISVIE